jgi:hypothetical protein
MISEIKVTIEENGQQKTGTIVSYIPEKRMIVRLNNGSIVELNYDPKVKLYSLETSVSVVDEGKASGNPLYILEETGQLIDTTKGGFGAGTLILMADGTEKPIEKVRAGDRVVSFEEYQSSGPLIAKRVLDTYERLDTVLGELVIVGSSYPNLRIFPDQLLIDSDSTWGTKDNILYLSDKTGERREFAYNQLNGNSFFVYNIEVEGTNTFIANNIRVHDSLTNEESEKFAASFKLVEAKQRAIAANARTKFYGTPLLPLEVASALKETEIKPIAIGDKSFPTVRNLNSNPAATNFFGNPLPVNIKAPPPNVTQLDQLQQANRIPLRSDKILSDAANLKSSITQKVVFEGSTTTNNFNIVKSSSHLITPANDPSFPENN